MPRVKAPGMFQLSPGAPLSQQLGAQAGNILGGGLVAGMQGLLQKREQEKLEPILKEEDPATRYNLISEHFLNKGDYEQAQKFSALALRQQEHELSTDRFYEGRDKGLRDYALSLSKHELDSDRIAALIKYYAALSNSQGKKVAKSVVDKNLEIIKASKSDDPDIRQAGELALAKVEEQAKNRLAVPTTTEFKSTKNILLNQSIDGIDLSSLAKEDEPSKAAFNHFAQVVANDAKAWMRANPTEKDWNKAVLQSLERNREYLKVTGSLWWKGLAFDRPDIKSSDGYTPAQETGISNVMKQNNISREQAIAALKQAGKL
jgi:hypothetical protein